MENKCDVSTKAKRDPIALHVLVVGFHHKKGMQVEYAYPPLSDSDGGCELPEKWKHLPSLCLPDGAHNHEADTIYFHLPHLEHDTQTVFGVSCYRQIDAEKVANKTADITRNTVQKSVCVLTTLPIYGYVQERLKVTTKVYFKCADFSDVSDLEGLYHDLNNTNWKDRLMHGICVSEAVRIFGRNILVLFKLLLLEQKVLFYHSPVAPLGRIITSLLALLPANLPEGLAQASATRYRGSPHLEAAREATSSDVGTNKAHTYHLKKSNESDVIVETKGLSESGDITTSSKVEEGVEQNENNSLFIKQEVISGSPSSAMKVDHDEPTTKIINVTSDEGIGITESAVEGITNASDEYSDRRSSVSSLTSVTSRGSLMSPLQSVHSPLSEGATANAANFSSRISSLKGKLSGAINYWTGKEKSAAEKPSSTATPNPSPSEPCDDIPSSPLRASCTDLLEPHSDTSSKSDTQQQQQPCINAEKYAVLEPSECGLPLQIFTKGNLLHPYLSLQYLDVLTSPSTRAFIVGASNTLFIHKKNLYDVVVQIEDGKIEVSDPDLKRQLNLSIEDLRFAENLFRQVEAVNATAGSGGISSSLADVFLDGVGWMGGEEWLRHQFKVYLLALLRSSLCPDVSREYEVYNSSFVSAWKQTHNYRMWLAGGPYSSLMELPPGHPNAGNLSMTDMRIRLSHTIQGLDRGRRLNQTLASTGTAVVKTREAFGGAITSAKGAITNFWSSFTSGSGNNFPERSSSVEVEEAMEATVEDGDEASHLLKAEESGPFTREKQVEEGKPAAEIELDMLQ